MSTEQMRLVPEHELLDLLNARDELRALQSGGVDNWDWYSESLREGGYWDTWDDPDEATILKDYPRFIPLA